MKVPAAPAWARTGLWLVGARGSVTTTATAPLMLDLARLTAVAQAAGYGGPLPALAFFCQDLMTDGAPLGSGVAPGGPVTRGSAITRLVRASAALTVLGDTVAGAAAAGRPLRGRRLVLPAASAALYWAGMALNDYADRAADAHERPERPIPSGQISPGQALPGPPGGGCARCAAWR